VKDEPISPMPPTTTVTNEDVIPLIMPTVIPNHIPPNKSAHNQQHLVMSCSISPGPMDDRTYSVNNKNEQSNYQIVPPNIIWQIDADLDYYPFCNVDISTDPLVDHIEIKMGMT
jgi:hypothetical protein